MSRQVYLARRVIEAADLIEDWGLGWHLGRVIECLSKDGQKGFAIDDLRAARWYLARKISALVERREDEPSPCTDASISPVDLCEDWKLHPHLVGVVSVIYHRRQYDIEMLREALGFLEQRLRVLSLLS